MDDGRASGAPSPPDARPDPAVPAPPDAPRPLPSTLRDPLAWTVAVAVALVIGFPHFLWWAEAGFRVSGPVFLGAPDEEYFAVRAREVVDGHPGSGHPYYREGKDLPAFFPILPELLIGGFARATGIPVPLLYQGLDFLLPLMGALLVFRLGVDLGGSRASGALTALLTYLVCFPVPQALWYWLGRPERDPYVFLPMYRTPGYPLGLLVLAPALFLWMKALAADRPPRTALLAGFLFGLLAHAYVFYAQFLGCVLIAQVLWMTVRERRLPLRPILYGALGAAIPLAALAWMYWRGSREGAVDVTLHADRHFVEPGFLWSKSVVVGLLLWWGLARGRGAVTAWGVHLAGGAIVAANLRWITGVNLFHEENHAYYWFTLTAAFLIGPVLPALAARLPGSPALRRAAGVALAVALLAGGLQVQWRWTQQRMRYFVVHLRYERAFAWLEALPAPRVVLASPGTSELVPLYTKHDIFFGSRFAALYTAVPAAEHHRRCHDTITLLDVPPEGVPAWIAARDRGFLQAVFGLNRVMAARPGDDGAMRRELVEEHARLRRPREEVRADARAPSLLVAGPLEVGWLPFDPDSRPDLERVHADGDVRIYRFTGR